MKKGFDFNFLKCPFRVNRMTAWFYSQVCSGTLHTRKVVSSLYSDQELDVRCPICGVEDESVLHCLVRCKTASIARKKLSVRVSRQLDKLGVKGVVPIDIWFDNTQWINGRLIKNKERKTSKEYLAGMMGMECKAVKQITHALISSGKKKDVAAKKASTFVENVKRQCVQALHKLFVKSKETDESAGTAPS